MQLTYTAARNPSSPFRSSRQLFAPLPAIFSPQPMPLPLSPQPASNFLTPPPAAFYQSLSPHIPPLPALPLFSSPASPLSHQSAHPYPFDPLHDDLSHARSDYLRLYEPDKEQQQRIREVALQYQQQAMLSSVQQATQLMIMQGGGKIKPSFTFLDHALSSTFIGAHAFSGGLVWPPSPLSGETSLSRLSYTTTSSTYSPSPASDSSTLSLPEDFDFEPDLLDVVERGDQQATQEAVGIAGVDFAGAGQGMGEGEEAKGRVMRLDGREVAVGHGDWVSAVTLQGLGHAPDNGDGQGDSDGSDGTDSDLSDDTNDEDDEEEEEGEEAREMGEQEKRQQGEGREHGRSRCNDERAVEEEEADGDSCALVKGGGVEQRRRR